MTNSYQPGFDSNYGTGATSLPLQGASRQAPMSGKPNDYLVLSVLSCIFGFFPLALAAILLSSRVDVLWAVGDYNGALDTAQRAKKFGIWANHHPGHCCGDRVHSVPQLVCISHEHDPFDAPRYLQYSGRYQYSQW